MRRPSAQGPGTIIMVAIPGEFTLPIPENSANERGGKKQEKKKTKPKASRINEQHVFYTVFDFDFQSTSASHLARTVIMSFLCQHV
jgi:hypothetical protein